MMDIDMIRTVLTAVMFAVFIGIVLWAWSGARKSRFDEAARLPLEDDLVEQQMARKGRAQS